MGFSSSAATGILLVAALISMSMYVPAVMDSKTEQASALDRVEDSIADTENTELTVTMVACSNPVEIEAMNTGSTSWVISDTEVLVDGSYLTSGSYETVVGSNPDQSLVMPGETLTVTAPEETAEQTKLITPFGVAGTDSCT
jgi:archaellum component FlaF (FlaF/FlaG flagellin family)